LLHRGRPVVASRRGPSRPSLERPPEGRSTSAARRDRATANRLPRRVAVADRGMLNVRCRGGGYSRAERRADGVAPRQPARRVNRLLVACVELAPERDGGPERLTGLCGPASREPRPSESEENVAAIGAHVRLQLAREKQRLLEC